MFTVVAVLRAPNFALPDERRYIRSVQKRQLGHAVGWSGAFACIVLASGVFASPAAAQQHLDGAAELGLQKRFLTGRPDPVPQGAEASNAGFGPVLRVSSHLAILPLFRAGLYGVAEYSPGPFADRILVGGGIDLRATLPLRISDVRAFLATGFGYIRGVQFAYAGPGAYQPGAYATSQSGGCFEVPLGIGAVYKFRKPYEIGGILGPRFGFGCHGAMYRNPTTQGNDSLTLGLAVTLGFDK